MSFLTALGVDMVTAEPLTCGWAAAAVDAAAAGLDDDEKTTEAIALSGEEELREEVEAIPSSVASSSRAISTGLCEAVPSATSSPAECLLVNHTKKKNTNK